MKHKNKLEKPNEISQTDFSSNIINLERAKKTISERAKNENKNEVIDDVVFKEIIMSHLLRTFYNDLETAGLLSDVIDNVSVKLSEIENTNELMKYLNIPYDVRKFNFPRFKEMSSEEVFSELKKIAQLEDFPEMVEQKGAPKIGFHVSGREIQKRKDSSGRMTWQIDGTENSDFAPGKQAYAADCFKGLYKEGDAKKLYIVRIFGDGGKYDCEQGWHHANSFSIITELDMAKTLELFNKIMEVNREELEAVA